MGFESKRRDYCTKADERETTSLKKNTDEKQNKVIKNFDDL